MADNQGTEAIPRAVDRDGLTRQVVIIDVGGLAGPEELWEGAGGGGGGGTEYTEDAVASGNPVGGALILVRNDTPAGQVSADGDNVAARGTDFGAQYVTLLDTGGTPVAVGGGTQYTEDAAAAANPIGNATILVRNDTPAGQVSADGDNVAARGTNFGAAYVTLLDTGGAPVAVGGGTQYTEDAAAAANPIGNATILVRQDTLAPLVSADGDNVVARGTNLGEMYVQDATAIAEIANLSLSQFLPDFAIAGSSGWLVGGRASTAAPADVSADDEGQFLWLTRKGALNIADAGGTLTVDDGGASLTVDGTVAVSTLGGTVAVTQSGVWDEVGINDSGNSITVDNAALSVVGGGVEATALRVTVASDSTGVLSVDDNGASLTVDGTVAVSSVGGTVAVTQSGLWDEVGIHDSGNSITVDGTVAITSADLATVAGAVRAEDVASADAHTGMVVMAVRRATPANASGTDGDYEQLQVSAGRLWVDASGTTLTVASHAVTNAGTFLVQAVGNVAEDAAISGSPVLGAVRAHDAVPTAMSANNDVVIPWADRSGAQAVIPQPRQVRLTATPTIATSGYVDNDQIGTEMSFAAALASGRGGMVVGAGVITETVTALNGLELWLFEADPTAASSDSAAWDISDANLLTARPFAVIDFTAADYRNTASGAWCKGEEHAGPVSAPFVTSGSANIFGYLVANGTPAAQYGATDDLIVILHVQQF